MSDKKQPEQLDLSRRDFLQALGMALGGVVIGGGTFGTAYGQGGGIPSGYTFYRVLTVGTSNANEQDVGGITPGVMVGSFNSAGNDPNLGSIFFHGSSKKTGDPCVFRMLLSWTSGRPVFEGLELFLYRNQQLDFIDGVPAEQLPLIVSRIGTGSANAQGNYATTLGAEDTGETSPDGSISLNSLPGVFLYASETKTWRNVARCGDTSPDGGKYGGIMGDVVLHDDNSVTFVAATTDAPSITGLASATGLRTPRFAGSHALVHMDESGQASVLLKTGDMLPRTNAMVESFGLIDVVKGRDFVAQVNARRVDIVNPRIGTAIVQGRIGIVKKRRTDGVTMLAASHHVLPESMQKDDSVIVGESIIGPRIGWRGLAAVVTHDPFFDAAIGELEKHCLSTVLPGGRRTLIVRAGDAHGPRVVSALSAPVVSSEAEITYVAELLDDGTTQLVVTDGHNRQIILQSGELIGGASVTEINHGYHPAQVDVGGRLAFGAEFLKNPNGDPHDPGNVETSLVVGIPA